jgi:hypothetical protein
MGDERHEVRLPPARRSPHGKPAARMQRQWGVGRVHAVLDPVIWRQFLAEPCLAL